MSRPNKKLWDFLKEFIIKYDMVVLSSEEYKKADLPVEQRIINPAIDPLALKNRELPQKDILKYIKKAGIPTDKPIITQVSRLDPWKDPEGVLEVFHLVREKIDCRLIFCYNMASDDPEGTEIYNKTYSKAKKLAEKRDVIFVIGNNDILVNSVQSVSDIIIQKSIKEGFSLTVTEALWKGKPVVASEVGGIPLQITDGENGFLLEPRDTKGFADRIIRILENPKEAEMMGKKAKEVVRKKFPVTRLLSDYLDLTIDVAK